MVFTHSCAQEMNSKLTVNNPSPFLLPSPLPLPSPSPSISFPTQEIHYFRPTLTTDPPTLLHASTPLPPQANSPVLNPTTYSLTLLLVHVSLPFGRIQDLKRVGALKFWHPHPLMS